MQSRTVETIGDEGRVVQLRIGRSAPSCLASLAHMHSRIFVIFDGLVKQPYTAANSSRCLVEPLLGNNSQAHQAVTFSKQKYLQMVV